MFHRSYSTLTTYYIISHKLYHSLQVTN